MALADWLVCSYFTPLTKYLFLENVPVKLLRLQQMIYVKLVR